MTKTCTECHVKSRDAVRTAALGPFAYLCPDCRREFDAALAAPTDLSLRDLDLEALGHGDLEEVPCRS
jgi:hypothetical protein